MKNNNVLIIGAIFMSAIAFLIFNPDGILTYIYSSKELSQISKKMESKQNELLLLENKLDSLINSTEYIEKIIRYKYHMTMPDEDIYKILREH